MAEIYDLSGHDSICFANFHLKNLKKILRVYLYYKPVILIRALGDVVRVEEW